MIASSIGALQGGLFGLTSGFLMKRFTKFYRNTRFPVHVLYQCFCIAYVSAFKGDRQVTSFQQRYFEKEQIRRKMLLDKAADNGIFLEEDAILTSTIRT